MSPIPAGFGALGRVGSVGSGFGGVEDGGGFLAPGGVGGAEDAGGVEGVC